MLIYIRKGDGTPITRMYIHDYFKDATNQCNMNIYHIDGTYHITISNFPLFDRTNMNRRFFLLIIYIILQPFKFVE